MVSLGKEADLGSIEPPKSTGKWKSIIKEFTGVNALAVPIDDVVDTSKSKKNQEKQFRSAYHGLRNQRDSQELQGEIGVVKRNADSEENRAIYLIHLDLMKQVISESEDVENPENLDELSESAYGTLLKLFNKVEDISIEDIIEDEDEDEDE